MGTSVRALCLRLCTRNEWAYWLSPGRRGRQAGEGRHHESTLVFDAAGTELPLKALGSPPRPARGGIPPLCWSTPVYAPASQGSVDPFADVDEGAWPDKAGAAPANRRRPTTHGWHAACAKDRSPGHADGTTASAPYALRGSARIGEGSKPLVTNHTPSESSHRNMGTVAITANGVIEWLLLKSVAVADVISRVEHQRAPEQG